MKTAKATHGRIGALPERRVPGVGPLQGYRARCRCGWQGPVRKPISRERQLAGERTAIQQCALDLEDHVNRQAQLPL